MQKNIKQSNWADLVSKSSELSSAPNVLSLKFWFNQRCVDPDDPDSILPSTVHRLP